MNTWADIFLSQSQIAMDGVTTKCRWAVRADLPEVLRIEQHVFRDQAWTRKEFEDTIRRRDTILMVLETKAVGESSGIAGYCVYQLLKNRILILNIAVHPEDTRCGYGRSMIEKLAAKLDAEKRASLVVETKESNVNAQLFFRAVGFRMTRTLSDYCGDGEDAYVFTLGVEDAAARTADSPRDGADES